mmetsp:Transcript_30766/g.48221  ORF Transcript_30766/g.48221 Transcript_30766/m.48221 type:complete len:166 (+) Transcript_30766:389-886(+)
MLRLVDAPVHSDGSPYCHPTVWTSFFSECANARSPYLFTRLTFVVAVGDHEGRLSAFAGGDLLHLRGLHGALDLHPGDLLMVVHAASRMISILDVRSVLSLGQKPPGGPIGFLAERPSSKGDLEELRHFDACSAKVISGSCESFREVWERQIEDDEICEELEHPD